MRILGSVTRWIRGLRDGNDSAAQNLWERYHGRLIHLVRKRLRGVSRRMADEEDVVVCAFDSFYRGVRGNRFPRLEDRDDLWQLLVVIAGRKAANQRKHALRQKRGGGRSRGDSIFARVRSEHSCGSLDEIIGQSPDPAAAFWIAENFRSLLDRLPDNRYRGLVLWKMEGWTNDEIAEKLGCKTRTVERKLHIVRQLWSQEPSL
jgi:RNA polymerase sigma factor (sigma-70 family)